MRVLFILAAIALGACPSAKTSAEKSGGRVADLQPEELFAGLPLPVIEPHDETVDVLRLGPVPRPEASDEALPFPPPEAPPVSRNVLKAPPLEVVRRAPEGDVGLVGQLVVAFNQPMVPLASVGELGAKESPLELSPMPPGRFRWLDTRTLAFEPEGRLPFATRYEARVRAGAESALGQALREDVRWVLSTPRPALVESAPRNGATTVAANDAVLLRFNAAVEPDDVARFLKLTKEASGRAVPVKVERAGSNIPTYWEPDRTVLIRPAKPLDLDSRWVVDVLTGLPSSEGPLPLTSPAKVSFRTYAPLAGEAVGCAWGAAGEPCAPGVPLTVRFNNPLARQALASLVEVTPAVEELSLQAFDRTLQLRGRFNPATTYRVTVKAGLVDDFGQKLNRAFTGSVRIGPMPPSLSLTGSGSFVALERGVSTVLAGLAVNVPTATLSLARVEIDRLDEARRWVSGRPENDLNAFAKDVTKRAFSPSRQTNAWESFRIDVAEALGAREDGVVAVELEIPPKDGRRRVERTLVVLTGLGLTATWSADRIHVLVTALADGSVVEGATVEFRSNDKVATAKTDGAGHATLDLPRSAWQGTGGVVARAGREFSLLDISSRYGLGYPYASTARESALETIGGMVFTDRGAYRPGETVHVTAFARRLTHGPDGDVEPLKVGTSFDVVVRDARGDEVARSTATADAFGTLSFDIDVPPDAALGMWDVAFVGEKNGGRLFGNFNILEYRVPEFQVAAKTLGTPPFLADADATFGIDASYFFGAPLSGAAFDWGLTRSSVDYRPPGNDGFKFGIAPPRWFSSWGRRRPSSWPIASGSGALGSNGSARLVQALVAGEKEYSAFAFEFEATVTDVNRQQISARTSLLAHRTLERVGLRAERAVLRAGEDVVADAIVTDLDGKRIEGRTVELVLLQMRPKTDPGEPSLDEPWGEHLVERVEVARCSVATASDPMGCRLNVPKSGDFVLRASVDTPTGVDAAEVSIIAQGHERLPLLSDSDALVLIPDKESYEGGETARILVRSPLADSRGFFVVGREGFARVVPLEIKGGSAVVEIAVEGRWTPSVEVFAIAAAGRSAPPPSGGGEDAGRPRWVSGQAMLNVGFAERRLRVEAHAASGVAEPGGEVEFLVATRSDDGEPVAASATVMLVDEAVLSLTGFTTPSPLEAIYTARAAGVETGDSRALLMTHQALGGDEEMVSLGGMDAVGRGLGGAQMFARVGQASKRGMAAESDAAPFAVRSDFRSTPFIARSVKTGSDGKATLRVRLPDNLTEFRLMVVASDGKRRFGTGDTRVVVRQPLLVRPSLPRFLNLGDEFEAAAVVNNESTREVNVLVRLRAVNAQVDESLQTLKLAAGEGREVRFKAKAGQPGPAKFQFAVVDVESRRSDAAEIVVPTLLPATAEAFATYGSTLESVAQPVSPPDNVLPGFGGLQVTLSSTALNGLEDAARYLVDYPFACVEQAASRLVPLVVLGDLFDAFRLDGAGTPEQRKRQVEENLSVLARAQRDDGGFPFWAGGERSWLFLTAWVSFVLQEMGPGGGTEREEMSARALRFLESALSRPAPRSEVGDEPVARTLAALVLARQGRVKATTLEKLEEKGLPLFAKAWLMEAWALVGNVEQVGRLVRDLENAAAESAGSVHFAERRTESLRVLMHSNDRTDAIVLRALLKVRPEHPLVEKVQRGLNRAMVRGRWSTTQANAWALLAEREYFERFEKEAPAFDARVWAGDVYIGGKAFEGRALGSARVTLPMTRLLDAESRGESTDVLIAKEGVGRLYYRLGLRYAPASLRLQSLDSGFIVSRTYSAIDKPSDVTRDDDGTWRIKAGARVRVRLEVVSPDRRYWVALVDPLPAGLEPIDPALATSARGADVYARPWHARAWNHTELRDDQARAFADVLWTGVWQHEYDALATTPGEFTVPPSRIEEMYAPETFGRSATDRVVVEL